MNRLVITACLAVAGSSLAGCSSAAVPAQSAEHYFVTLDYDGDDRIDVEEFRRAFFVGSFFRLDRDGDGTITRAEWDEIEVWDGAGEMFEEMDVDGSFSLTREEFSAPAHKQEITAELFSILDTDGDGYLVRTELMTLSEKGTGP